MKMKLFSRVTAVVLTLAMLIPCVMIAPASAAETDPAVTNLYHYKATAGGDTSRNKFRNEQFPNNIVDAYDGKSSEQWRIFQQYSYTHYGVDGPKKLAFQGMQLANSPTWNGSTSTKRYSGRPVEMLANKSRILDNVWFDLGEVEYPIITRGIGALNISFQYFAGAKSLGATDQLKVFISLDGETFLEDSVGIRSEEFLGVAGTTTGSTVKYLYRLETENLLKIKGFKPGNRILKIRVRPYAKDSTYAQEIGFHTLDLNSYATEADFDRLVPADVREYVHVGEDTMRQIVVDEGQRTANIKWTTDSEVHTITGSNHIQHMPGIEYRGSAYGRDIDASRELLESGIVNGKWMGGNNQDNFYTFDCQTFVFNAASRVSRTQAFACMYTFGTTGITILGKEFLNLPEVVSFSNYDVIQRNTKQDMFKSYALAKPGDHEVTYTTTYDGQGTNGSHVRIVVENHPFYNEDGTIDGSKSYVLSTEQAMFATYEVELADGTRDSYQATGSNGWTKFQTWLKARPGAKVLYGHSSQAASRQTYNALYNADYVLCTSEFFKSGDIELQKIQAIFAPRTAGKSIPDGGVVVAAVSNYRMVAFGVKLEDLSTGEVLFDNFRIRAGNNSAWGFSFVTATNLDAKLKSLSNGSYRLSAVAHSGPLTAIGQTQVPINTVSYDFTITDRTPAAEVTLSAPESASKGQTVEVAVNVGADADAADVDVKFDTSALTFVSATQSDNIIVTRNNGLVSIMAVDAGVSSGNALTKLTFTANADIAKLADAIKVKSAFISTADAANTADATKAIDGTDVCPSINFGDVSNAAWYHNAVDYVVDNNVMSGFGGGRFGPDEKLSRAMVVQVLYNHEGQPAEAAENNFPDVKAADWYFNATRWGAKKGVVSGFGNGTFAPNDNVTVEQIAVILHNYAGKPTASGDLSSVGKYDDWAASGLQWAVANGVLENVPFTNATETATRAQTAQMLMNFLSK